MTFLRQAGPARVGHLTRRPKAPYRSVRTRWRRLLGESAPRASPARRPLSRWRREIPGIPMPLVAAVAGLSGMVAGGPVAAAVLACYGGLGARLWRRAAIARAEGRSRADAVEAVAALAAELRAGSGVSAALAEATTALDGPAVIGADAATVARRVVSAVEVAESSGAPLADVLDRLDVHLRAVERARATAAAQAAGARASALMLAAMPVAGAGLGFLVGLDPFQTLLHTPIGAACLVAAVALQLGGLAWAGRLSRVEVSA
ncbi:MAG TPA: hypothetical protein VF163_22715 [Micromonosporaceae bacterium]